MQAAARCTFGPPTCILEEVLGGDSACARLAATEGGKAAPDMPLVAGS